MPEENVIKMRHEINLHNNQKQKTKKTNAKRQADKNIDAEFFFKKDRK